MEIRPLEAFAAVMSAGSITAAARLLGRSQPVVTREIQDLESSIGYLLFSRSGPRITPTPRGLLFHAEVERLLLGLKHLSERSAAIRVGSLPVVSVAAIPALAAGLVPQAIAAMEEALLPRQIHVQALSAEHVVQSVLARAADIGLASLPVEYPGLDVQWIGEVPCVACMASDHPLAQHETIALKDLGGHRLLTLANPYRLRRRIEAALAEADVTPARIIETNASLIAIAMARLGLGIAIVEPVLACAAPMEGIAVRPLDVAIPFTFAVISAAAGEVTPTIAAMQAALRAATARIPGIRFHTGSAARALAGVEPAEIGDIPHEQ